MFPDSGRLEVRVLCQTVGLNILKAFGNFLGKADKFILFSEVSVNKNFKSFFPVSSYFPNLTSWQNKFQRH